MPCSVARSGVNTATITREAGSVLDATEQAETCISTQTALFAKSVEGAGSAATVTAIPVFRRRSPAGSMMVYSVF